MRLNLWLRAMRAQFFLATAMPVVLGTAIAWAREGAFSLHYFILTLLGVALINMGANLANDYFDHRSDWRGSDDINKEPNPFGGGSHVIQEKLLTPREMFIGAIIAFIIAALIGIYLVMSRGFFILVLGIIGISLAYFYTAPPIRLGYRGLGEIAVGIACGLPVLGAYYVQVQKVTLEAFILFIPMAILIANLLWLNQFPDYPADKAASKNTLVVKLGRDKAIRVYYFLLLCVYIIILLGILFKIIPIIGLIAFLSLPLALKIVKIAKANYMKTEELIPAMAGGIQLPMVIAILLCVGYIIARAIGVI